LVSGWRLPSSGGGVVRTLMWATEGSCIRFFGDAGWAALCGCRATGRGLPRLDEHGSMSCLRHRCSPPAPAGTKAPGRLATRKLDFQSRQIPCQIRREVEITTIRARKLPYKHRGARDRLPAVNPLGNGPKSARLGGPVALSRRIPRVANPERTANPGRLRVSPTAAVGASEPSRRPSDKLTRGSGQGAHGSLPPTSVVALTLHQPLRQTSVRPGAE